MNRLKQSKGKSNLNIRRPAIIEVHGSLTIKVKTNATVTGSKKSCGEKLEEYKRNSISIKYLLDTHSNSRMLSLDTNINDLRQLLKNEQLLLHEFAKDLHHFRNFVPEFPKGPSYSGLIGLRLIAQWNWIIVDIMGRSFGEEKRNDRRVKKIKSLQKNELKQLKEAVEQVVRGLSKGLGKKTQTPLFSERKLYDMLRKFEEEGKQRLKPQSFYPSLEAGFAAFEHFLSENGIKLDTNPRLKKKLWAAYKDSKKRLTFLRVSFGYLYFYHYKLDTSQSTVLKRVNRLIHRYKPTK